MLLSAEVVGHVPVVRPCLAGSGCASLHVLRVRLLATAVAAHVGADQAPGDGAARGCDVPAASAADLMAENSADQCADHRTGHIGVALVPRDLLMLHPATL